MAKELATAKVLQFDEYKDVFIRFYSVRGSTPIQVVVDGEIQPAEQIGQQILEMFEYFIQTPYIPIKEEEKE